uniref:Trehalase n=1 Tax=Meloidogyne incognita TaxID=6306 RepID=A0A914LRC5_MELIC
MYDTAKGTILNLIYMVENHGFVPNGVRVYYLSRSQPPLLTPMVYEYFLATGDVDFVQQVLPALEKEQTFWNLNRARSFLDPETKEELFQYYQYRAAMKVKGLNTDEEREQMWSNLASAAETGWGFSTRWFAQEGPSMHDFKSIRTLSIVPVDLNAFMCINMRILASFYEIFGDFKRKNEYYARYQKMKLAMKTFIGMRLMEFGGGGGVGQTINLFGQQVLPALKKEQTFWNLNRARSFLDSETKEELFQYYQYRAAMKPESYREDMERVKGLNTDEERNKCGLIWLVVFSI